MDAHDLYALLDGIIANPDIAAVVADALTKYGDPKRGEILRISYAYRAAPGVTNARLAAEQRMRQLLAAGVRPIAPMRMNSLGMEFAFIPPCVTPIPHDDCGHGQPPSSVISTRGFFMGVMPVTQAQWRAVMGDDPSFFDGSDSPVECVSWEACNQFCLQLRRLSGDPIRLPCEAEWEAACRAGTSSLYYGGDDESALNQVGWYNKNSNGSTQPVGQKTPNAWGLFDMHGNVYEWCQEECNPGFESPLEPDWRIMRGGAWGRPANDCQATSRRCYPEAEHGWNFSTGCRVCFDVRE